MIKEHISPSLLTGLVVADVKVRDDLLDYLRKRKLVERDAAGNEMILRMAVDQFIRIGTYVSEKLIKT